MTAEDEKLYSPREAVDYIRKNYGKDVKLNSLYRSAERLHMPKFSLNGREVYRLTPQQLERIATGRVGRKKTAVFFEFPVVDVHSSSDMERLQKQYGEIIDDQRLLQVIWERHGVRLSGSALKTRRSRQRLPLVARSGDTHWYALDYIPPDTIRAKEK